MIKTSGLETTIGEWYTKANLPHLPKEWQQWLAKNLWWLTLIGAVVSIIGLLALVPIFLAAITVTSIVNTATLGYAAAYTPTYTGLYWLGALISIVSYVITTVLLVMAIKPLKVSAKKGWSLLFLSYLISIVLAVASDVFTLNFIGIFSAAISAAISGYFLYEIRSFFVTKHKEHLVKTAKK